MIVRRAFWFFLFANALATRAIFAFSDLHNTDPLQWTSSDVYTILNNSPWSKKLKINFSEGSNLLGNQNTGVGSTSNNTPVPAGVGGTGRRGMGGGRSQGTYSSGGSGSTTPGNPKSGPTEVTVQWQSALVVQMAAAKKAGGAVDAASFKRLDEYVIAVIGLPITVLGGRAASADSDNTLSQEEEQRAEERVKSAASILRSGHDPLAPTKVELDQGSDGRMLIHFPKSDPVNVSDKSVEFRLVIGRSELRKKFPLADMEYQGKLDL